MKKLEDYGFIQSRPKGEFHVNNQQMSKLLHKAVGLGGRDVQNGQVCPPPPALPSPAPPVNTRRNHCLLLARRLRVAKHCPYSMCLQQEAYSAYEQHFKDSPPAVLRDCLELKSDLDPISVDQVCQPLRCAAAAAL